MRAWAEAATHALLDQLGLKGEPPINVVAIAHALGVEAIVTSDQFGDGRLENDGQRRVIVVQRAAGAGRQRFTIAHELGHIYLRDRADASLPIQREEHFCDMFAESLLMPRWWVRRWRHASDDLTVLRSFGEQSGVSLAAALLRLRRVAGWTSTLLRWRLVAGEWRLDAVTGQPHALAEVRSTSQTREVLWTLHSERHPDAAGRLSIGVGEREIVAPAQVSIGRRSAVALIDLSTVRIGRRDDRWIADLYRRLVDEGAVGQDPP